MAGTSTRAVPQVLSAKHQEELLFQMEHECKARVESSTVRGNSSEGGVWCPAAWDGMLCWDRALNGTLSSLPCPSYVIGLQHQARASRLCLPDGRWFVHPDTAQTWTNYTLCLAGPDATVVMDLQGASNVTGLESYMGALKAISRAGYGVSLASLVIAFCILASIKRLRCPRNMLHLHLFASFIMRAFMSLLKDSLLVMGLGLSSDIVVKTDGSYYGSENEENWECKLIVSLWQYFIMANYSWILMEGLYLHNLIFLALFSDTSSIKLYVSLGWGLPAVCVVSWISCRVVLENTLCWTTNENLWLFIWCIRVPTTVSILLNFFLFVNIVRVLLVKLRSTVCEETKMFRRWAKSTLVLVPLFGVHYTVFLGMSYSMGVDKDVEVAWLFCDQLFASFQGFFVAVLYCFLNGEVRAELGKKWRRSWARHGGSCSRRDAGARSQSRGRRHLPRASCYSSTSCTSLSVGAGAGWLATKRRSTVESGLGELPGLACSNVSESLSVGAGAGWLATKRRSTVESGLGELPGLACSNVSEVSRRMSQDRRWSRSDYSVAGSVLEMSPMEKA